MSFRVFHVLLHGWWGVLLFQHPFVTQFWCSSFPLKVIIYTFQDHFSMFQCGQHWPYNFISKLQGLHHVTYDIRRAVDLQNWLLDVRHRWLLLSHMPQNITCLQKSHWMEAITCLEWAVALRGIYESFLVDLIITIYMLQAQFFNKSCEIKLWK